MYQIKIHQLPNGRCALRVARQGASACLLSWNGETARRLIAWAELNDGQQVSKHRVRELAVAGAAAGRSEGVISQCAVEKTVKDRRGLHLSEDELVEICLSEYPGLTAESIRKTLLELTRQQKIQRIPVEEHLVFYDADTTAHLHLFDPTSRRLFDAPENGVLVGHYKQAPPALSVPSSTPGDFPETISDRRASLPTSLPSD